MYIICVSVEHERAAVPCTDVWAFAFVPLLYMPVFVLIAYLLLQWRCDMSVVWKDNLYSVVRFAQDCFGYLGVFEVI